MSAESWWIKIDNVLLPTPDTCPITEYDLDSAATGRAESGYLFRERVRPGLFSCDLAWSGLTPEQANLIRDALAPVSFEVQIRFLGDTITKTMYAGDRKWVPAFLRDCTERWDLTCQLSEF